MDEKLYQRSFKFLFFLLLEKDFRLQRYEWEFIVKEITSLEWKIKTMKNDTKFILRVEYWNIASASSIKLIINDYSPIRRREMEETTKEILYRDEEKFEEPWINNLYTLIPHK